MGQAGLAVAAIVATTLACGGKHQSSTFEPGEGGKGPGPSVSGSGQGGTAPSSSGTGNSAGSAGTASAMGGASPSAGAGGVSGTAGNELGGAGGATEPEPPVDPYAPRSGSFRMLVYSRTTGFRHQSSINTGKVLLQTIASEQGFEVVMTETNELITTAGLAQFELVFFLNPTGDIFELEEEQAFETWMTTRHGAFVGVHSATDVEYAWPFYLEVTGQVHDGHGAANVADSIVFEAGALAHPALQGLPNPWPRAEEWSKFNSYLVWQSKPGFQILGRKAADGQPAIWTRQWGNFRSFYSELGHEGAALEGSEIKQHLTGGIMWAVRREHLIQ